MSATINPELKDLQHKVEEMRINLAKTQGEIDIIKHNSERNDRQTTRQFILFTITMLIAVVTSLIGSSIFQTDALRREMNAKFDGINQRFDNVNQRLDGMDKRIDTMDQRIDTLTIRIEKLGTSVNELKTEVRSIKR